MARMKMVELGDILPEQGVAEVQALFVAGKGTARHLKPVLAKYEKILGEKGVLVDYLAYALECVFSHTKMGD